MSVIDVGVNPLHEEFKKRDWKYKDCELTEKQEKQYLEWGWKRYALVDGDLVQDAKGCWAKNPDIKTILDEREFDPNAKGVRQHCSSGGVVYEQDGRFFTIKGVFLENFDLKEWAK